MKKLFSFLRSMRFGIILLVLIAVCSVAGSVIPQGNDVSWYAQNYGRGHAAILLLGLDHIFRSWYFISLLAFLCLNLLFCSVLRIRHLLTTPEDETARIAGARNTEAFHPGQEAVLREYLEKNRCRAVRYGDTVVYTKNRIGRYGTFITHLSILLVTVFGAAALYLPEVTDRTCLPGEALVMEDGTEIAVDRFSIEDPSGELDFNSTIRIRLPNGRESGEREIRVNEPCSFGAYKVYQQTYGTAGRISVVNTETGGSDDPVLTETTYLSAEEGKGIWYRALYPGYLEDPDGNVTIIQNTSGSYDDPVYDILVESDGEFTPTLAFPGDDLTIGGLRFSFGDPVEYPGLRIKRTPVIVNALLILTFVLMVAGLYITFFLQPVLVKTDGEGYVVGGPKPEGMRIRLRALLESAGKENQS